MTARSRSSLRLSSLVLAGLAFFFAAPSLASAERVVLYPVQGQVDPDLRESVEDALAASLARLGHTRVPAPGGVTGARPSTSAELDGIATSAGARYVVVPSVEAFPGQYRLHLVVGREGTVEELLVNVVRSEEPARLDDILRSMLRPGGLGDDALRLSGLESDADRAAREAEERARAEAEAARAAEERAAREAEEREREAREAEERARAEQERARAEAEAAEQAERARRASEADAWEHRPQLGSDGSTVVMVGVLGGGLVPTGASGPPPRAGGVQPPSGLLGVGVLEARVGYALEEVRGLELRAGLDVLLGGTVGLGLLVGASYQFTPFVAPIHIGAVVELGANFLFTGPKDAGFVGRLSAIASFTPIEHLSIEVALPELGYLSNGPGAVTFGASARVGYRF